MPSFGAYGHVALSMFWGDYDSQAALHAIQLGAFYRARFGDGDLVLHAGVIAPTSSGAGSE